MVSTWTETVVADLVGLGEEFNTVLGMAGLPALTRWYKGEPKPLKLGDTPYGWFHYAADHEVRQERRKQAVGSRASFLLCVVIGGATHDELIDRAAALMPRLAAHLETRSWPCNYEVGDWQLAVQDEEVHVDVYALPITLTWWRDYGASE